MELAPLGLIKKKQMTKDIFPLQAAVVAYCMSRKCCPSKGEVRTTPMDTHTTGEYYEDLRKTVHTCPKCGYKIVTYERNYDPKTDV